MPLLNREIKQTCPKCKGTGTSKEVEKDRDGRVKLAPIFEKGEGQRPQYLNCDMCGGEGLTLQPLPTKIMIGGEKRELSPQEAFVRVNPDVVGV